MYQQVDQLVTDFFRRVVLRDPVQIQFTAEDVIRDAEEEHHWQFRQLDYSSAIDESFEDDEFTYCDFDSLRGEYTLPAWAGKRLRWTRANFPVKQVIIGHEKENRIDEIEEEARQKAQQTARAIKTLLRGVAVLLGVAAVATMAVALAAVAVAIVAVAAFVSAPALLLADPLVIVVLDNEQEEWVCIARYLE